MKASYCNTIAGMHEIRHGSKSVARVICVVSIAFLATGRWHGCRLGAGALAARGASSPPGNLGEAPTAETAMFRPQWD